MMQSFKFEHRFSLPPVHLVRLLDDLAFRQYLVDNLANVHASERIRFDDTGYERFKTIRVYPKMNLPSWIERAFKDPESYFEMNYRLDKTRMVEKIEGTSHFGKVIGEVVYLPEGLSGTIRRFQGEFSCRFSVIGPAIEKFYLRHMEIVPVLVENRMVVPEFIIRQPSGFRQAAAAWLPSRAPAPGPVPASVCALSAV